MKRLVLLFVLLATPAVAQQSVFVPATMFSSPITISTATTTLLITGVSGKSTYITQVNVVAAGTGNIQFISGTGSTCGTGTVNLSGNYQLTAQQGFAMGTGNGTFWVAGSGLNVCAVTSANVGMPGSIAYAQF